MPKITEMFAFVVADKNEDDEGVLAHRLPDGGWAPMVGADMKRIDSLRIIADDLSQLIGKPYKVLRFKLDGEVK